MSQQILGARRATVPVPPTGAAARPPKAIAPAAHTPALEEDGSKDRQFVTALARGLDILRAFHAGDGMLGNQEIAARTGLPKPTVARLTHTLTELGYLIYMRRFRKYELGPSVLALGYASLANMDVRHVARGPMQQMAQALNCSVALGGRDRHSMIWLESHRGPSAVGVTFDVGSRMPIASTAMGRAYLAVLPEPEKSRLIDSIRRRWRDDWTKTKAGIDKAEKEIAERGFCLSWADWVPELCGVGAPLRSPDGETFFGFGVSAPIYQVSRERLEQEWGPRLVRLAREVRNGLAGRASTPNGHRPAARS